MIKTKIQEEFELSRKYELKQYLSPKGEPIVQLTKDNVALVESMIRHDSDYSDKATEKDVNWLKELAHILNGKKSNHSYATVVNEAVASIDRTNSTHINADGVGRQELPVRILKLSKETLVEYLKNPKKENYKLIEILSAPTTPDPKNPKMHARRNYSFATKFCHYVAFHVFEGKKEQDNFSIYDSIVANNIDKYASYYGITMPKDIASNYASFIKLVDDIIMKSGNNISRNGFDHLLWYFHKAR